MLAESIQVDLGTLQHPLGGSAQGGGLDEREHLGQPSAPRRSRAAPTARSSPTIRAVVTSRRARSAKIACGEALAVAAWKPVIRRRPVRCDEDPVRVEAAVGDPGVVHRDRRSSTVRGAARPSRRRPPAFPRGAPRPRAPARRHVRPPCRRRSPEHRTPARSASNVTNASCSTCWRLLRVKVADSSRYQR